MFWCQTAGDLFWPTGSIHGLSTASRFQWASCPLKGHTNILFHTDQAISCLFTLFRWKFILKQQENNSLMSFSFLCKTSSLCCFFFPVRQQCQPLIHRSAPNPLTTVFFFFPVRKKCHCEKRFKYNFRWGFIKSAFSKWNCFKTVFFFCCCLFSVSTLCWCS